MSIAMRTNTKHPFVFKDKQYEVSLVIQSIGAKIEKRIYETAKERLILLRETSTDPKKAKELEKDYQEQLAQLRDDYLIGKFCLEGTIGLQWLATYNGLLYLVELLFNTTKQDASELLVNARDQVVEIINLVINESYPFLAKLQEEGNTAEKAVDFQENGTKA
jgi:hypothetical protein